MRSSRRILHYIRLRQRCGKQKHVLLMAILTALLFGIAGCGSQEEDYNVNNTNRIILRLAETQPPNYPSSQGAMEFARLVESKSSGRIRVKIYDYGKLGDEASIIEQVQFGGIDLARVGAASLAKYSSRVNRIAQPYLFRTSGHMWQTIEGTVGDEIRESLLKEKITCLAWYEGGAKIFYNARRKAGNMEELRGLRISVQQSQMNMRLYSQMGVSLVPTKPGDIYSAIQDGNIDGAEDTIIAYYLLRHYEVAPYLTYDEHARIPEVIIGSRVTLLQLSKSDQDILAQAARQSALVQRGIWQDMEKEALAALHAKGIPVVYTDDASREKFLSAAEVFYTGSKQAEPDVATVIE